MVMTPMQLFEKKRKEVARNTKKVLKAIEAQQNEGKTVIIVSASTGLGDDFALVYDVAHQEGIKEECVATLEEKGWSVTAEDITSNAAGDYIPVGIKFTLTEADK